MGHYRMAAKVLTLALLFTFHQPLSAQQATPELLEIEEEFDTLSLFQLMDSLLVLQASRKSQFSIHVGYISEVSNAGRNLDIKQFGFNPGISYFHKSGIYGDLTGYWNSELDPSYDLTVLSLGYLGVLSQKVSYSLSYDHSFFTDPDPEYDLPPRILELLLPPLLNNTLSAQLDLDMNWIETSVDYSWLFNEESAHRIQWALTGDLKKYRWLFLDRISLRPSFSVLFGNQDIISISFSREAFLDRLFPILINKKNEFGVMNYRFSLPLGLTKQPFYLVAEYNYNIPRALPGEEFDYPNNSFFSIDLYYTFGIGSKKSIFE